MNKSNLLLKWWQLVVLNFSDHPAQFNLGAGAGKILLSTCLDRQDKVTLRKVQLRANEGIISEL